VDLGQSVADVGQSTVDLGRCAAAKSIYDTLTSELSQSVMRKLETGDDLVVSRLGGFLLGFAGKPNALAQTTITEKMVRFSSDGSGEAPSSAAVDTSVAAASDEEVLSTKNESLPGSSVAADLLGDDDGPMWRLVCDSCSLSFDLVHSRSSCRHLRFLAVVLRLHATDRLLTYLITRADLPSTNDTSVCRTFLEQMMLPLVDRFHSDEGSCHMLSILTSVYARLQANEQVAVAREVADRAARNLICADFLSWIVSSRELSGEVRCWLRGSEFGKFVVELTDGVCRRRLTVTQSDEVRCKSMVNEQSMDDGHWKLLCACLAVDEKSGLLCFAVLMIFLLINCERLSTVFVWYCQLQVN